MQIGRATVFSVVWSTKFQLKNSVKPNNKNQKGVRIFFFNRLVIQALTILLGFLVNPLISLLVLNGHLVLIFSASRSVKRFSHLFMLQHSGSQF